MTFELWVMCGIILLCVVLSGFFAGSETALTAASRARMMAMEQQGDERANVVQKLTARRDRLIGALLIGNNLANILSSSLATSIFLNLFGSSGVAYATLAMTVILVIFAEVLPKSWAISAPDRFSLAVARGVSLVVLLIGPLSSAVNFIVRAILRLFGVNLAAGRSMLSPQEELRGAAEVLHREGMFIKEDRDQLGGLLDLKELEVSDVMVHHTAMGTINADAPADRIVGEILASPHTRMPVWRDETDNIVGILHTKDLLRALHERPAEPWSVATLAREAALSRSAFFDRFTRTLGLAPMEYLLAWRMALAKNLLRREAAGVAEIAARVGYGSASAFTTAFTRVVGVSPVRFGRG